MTEPLYPSVRELARGWHSIVVRRGPRKATWQLIGKNGKHHIHGTVYGFEPVEKGHRVAKEMFDGLEETAR
jgi:hypothetical protein